MAKRKKKARKLPKTTLTYRKQRKRVQSLASSLRKKGVNIGNFGRIFDKASGTDFKSQRRLTKLFQSIHSQTDLLTYIKNNVPEPEAEIATENNLPKWYDVIYEAFINDFTEATAYEKQLNFDTTVQGKYGVTNLSEIIIKFANDYIDDYGKEKFANVLLEADDLGIERRSNVLSYSPEASINFMQFFIDSIKEDEEKAYYQDLVQIIINEIDAEPDNFY